MKRNTVVYTHASVQETVTGNSGDLPVAALETLTVDINVTAVDTNTAFVLTRKGTDGVYYPIWSPAAATGAGKLSESFGAGMHTAQALGAVVRLEWTLGGATVTFSASVQGG